MDQAVEICRRVFGLVGVCRAVVCEKDIRDIKEKAALYLKDLLEGVRTYKVETKRADKRFLLTSPQISREVGGYLSDVYGHLQPRMEDPQVIVRVEVREDYACSRRPCARCGRTAHRHIRQGDAAALRRH